MKPVVTLAVLSALLLTGVALAEDLDFVDVTSQHQAAAAVQRVVKAGLVSGFPDHTFRGWKPVSRYELIASTARLLPSEPVAAAPGPVLLANDVEVSHWAFPALARLHEVGIGQQLWADGTLAGDRPATRFDLAYLASQTCSVWSQTTAPTAGFAAFGDVPEGHWAAPAVRQAAELGLMGGLAANTFGGDRPIDRFQLAVVLDRVMARVRAGKPASTAVNAPSTPTGNVFAVEADGSMAPVPPMPAGAGETATAPKDPPPAQTSRPVAVAAQPPVHKPTSAKTKAGNGKPAKAKPAKGKPAAKAKAKPAKGKPQKAKPVAKTKAKPAKGARSSKPAKGRH